MCFCIFCLFFLYIWSWHFFLIHPYFISADICKHANAKKPHFGRRCQTSQWECNSKSVTSNFTLSEGGTCSISQPLIRSLSVEVCVCARMSIWGEMCAWTYARPCGCVFALEKRCWRERDIEISARVYVNVVCEKMSSYGFAYIWIIMTPFVFLLS